MAQEPTASSSEALIGGVIMAAIILVGLGVAIYEAFFAGNGVAG